MHGLRTKEIRLGNSVPEKSLGMLICQLNMNKQCVAAARRPVKTEAVLEKAWYPDRGDNSIILYCLDCTWVYLGFFHTSPLRSGDLGKEDSLRNLFTDFNCFS